MKYASILATVMLFTGSAVVRSQIAAGTIVPVSPCGSLNADRPRPGQEIRAEVMQDAPGTPIRRRARILGQVVAAIPSKSGAAKLVLRFDAVEMHGQRLPLKSSLRASASFMEVEAAQVPEEMSSRGITPEVATTLQIGGEDVYRGGGPVASGDTAVGLPTAYGVLAVPRARLGQPCRGVVDGNARPQALWLFSSDACGVYGYSNIRIAEAGRMDSAGTITLVAATGRLKLYDGSGLLLRIQGS